MSGFWGKEGRSIHGRKALSVARGFQLHMFLESSNNVSGSHLGCLRATTVGFPFKIYLLIDFHHLSLKASQFEAACFPI